MDKRYVLVLTEEQVNGLFSSFDSADRGRADFEYLASQNKGDYEQADVDTARASHILATTTEAAIRTALVQQKAGDVGDRSAHLSALIDNGLTFTNAVGAFSARQDDKANAYIATARKVWEKEGEIEIDDATIASGSSGDGDYVLAWVWVTNEEAGITTDNEDDKDEDATDEPRS